MTAAVVLVALTTLLACISLGGGLYESIVLDPVWPGRPAIVQAQHGGVSRRRFWVPAHTLFEIVLVVTVGVTWGQPDVRTALLVAVASHAVMRLWSGLDFIPKAIRFEKADPATVDRVAAVRWTRRSLLRLPLDLVTCGAALLALALVA